MRICWMVLVAGCMMVGLAHADMIRLKNGNVVEGKIIEKTADGIKVDIGGVTLTYYADEVESVAEAAAETAASVAEAPAPEAPVVFGGAPEAEVKAKPEAPEPAASPVVAAAPVPDELAGLSKEDLIKKFVQIYGVKENMQANFDQMTTTLKPDQAEAFRQSVKVDEIVQLLLPVYDKHFGEDDLRAYIRFYTSAEGRKLVQTLPLLMKDSVEVSMKYLDTHLPESLKQEQPAEGK